VWRSEQTRRLEPALAYQQHVVTRCALLDKDKVGRRELDKAKQGQGEQGMAWQDEVCLL
jgi:hypothetical protein